VISPGAVIVSVLPFYLLLVAGALLRKIGVLRPEHDAGAMQVVYSVMLPCFVLDQILGAEVLRSGTAVAWGITLGFALLLSGMLTAWCMARLLGLERGTGLRTFTVAAGCQNYGFTAIPVLSILWGSSACAMLFVHNIGVEVAMWSAGVMIISGQRGVPWRKLVNGPIIAVGLGLLLVALRLDRPADGPLPLHYATDPLRKVISLLGVGAFPVAILITGATMVGFAGNDRPSLKILGGAVLVRLLLAPGLILAAAKYLPLVVELRQVLVVQAAMPAAMTPIMLARMYGGRPSIAVHVVLATTLGSLLSLPWIIFWGIEWIGLKPLLP